MHTGTVVSVHIAPTAEARMMAVAEARAVPGKGLTSDLHAWKRRAPGQPRLP